MSILQFLQAQNTKIQRQVNDTTFADILYPSIVPVDTSGNEYASSVTFLSSEAAGGAEFINLNADDVPKVETALKPKIMPVYDAGIGYGFGHGEVQQAQAIGYDLKADRAIAARRAFMEKVESVVFAGDGARGMVGFAGISGTYAKTGTAISKWVLGTTTAQAIYANLLTLLNLTGNGNKPSADTILLEANQYVIAASTFFPNGVVTALDMLKQIVPNLEVHGIAGLVNGSSKELYIAYRRSPEVIALEMPMAHKFLPVWQSGPLRFEVPGIFRVAGLNFKRKQDIAFLKAS